MSRQYDIDGEGYYGGRGVATDGRLVLVGDNADDAEDQVGGDVEDAGSVYVFSVDPPAPLPGITVNPASGLITSEGGDAEVFTVVLDSEPAADVTIAIASSDTGEGTVDVSNLVFTRDNWDVAQPVTVTGVDDDIADGDQPYGIIVGPALSGDPEYQGLSSAVAAINLDDDAVISEEPLFVYDIRFESERGGKDWRAVFEIRSDSNGDGLGTELDDPCAGVSARVEFAGEEYVGTTDSEGLFRTSWWKNLPSGDHLAEVVDLALDGFVWDPLALDLEGDSDGDGNPDQVLPI
jgi:hypothetical protein